MQFRGSNTKEAAYQRKLIQRLRKLPKTWWAIKEARAIRGLPDIYGCVNGNFVTLEVKKNQAEAMETTGRIVLQRKTINDVKDAGGFAEFVYPENEEFIINLLIELINKPS